ncbi:MAG: pilus assembly protein N-terminal domain-containing protein [Planctomycetota bacterium]|nr:pilus assembly protein N-terminal domain-containing protein [Planctomycetota bacterium]
MSLKWTLRLPLQAGSILATLALGLTAVDSAAVAQGRVDKPEASAELRTKVTDLVDEIYESEAELQVTLRRSKIMKMKQDIFRVAVADPSIIEFVAFGSREVEVIGKETGTTSMTLWLGTPEQARLINLTVNVTKDDSVEDRRRLEYGELQKMINAMFPDSKIQLVPIADKVIVRGEARDEQEAVQIMAILSERGGSGGSFLGGNGNMISQTTAADPFPDAVELPEATLVDMLRVPGEKQVMLKVRIAELKRSASRDLGVNFDFTVGDFAFASAMTTGSNMLLRGIFDEDKFNLFLNAVATNGYGKILAEPNLVTLSGVPAYFISGGQFAVPTVVGVGGAQAATTSFKGYGTQLAFTPTVLDKDRIRLQVNPTFSTLNKANSVGGVFGLDTRAVSTTVDLREGQVFAIAGLIQEQQAGELSRVPFLGDLPLVKVLFQSKAVSRDETELLVLVSPEIVHAMEPETAPTILPGMEVTEPDDREFYVHGQIEGLPDMHHRSTVWQTYQHRMHQHGRLNRRIGGVADGEVCEESDNYYIQGEHGFSK